MDGIHLNEYSLESELPTRTLTIPVPILSYFNPDFFANKPFDEMSWQNEGEVSVCVCGGVHSRCSFRHLSAAWLCSAPVCSAPK